jgi:membrane protease YdiL (CAAX protease family)
MLPYYAAVSAILAAFALGAHALLAYIVLRQVRGGPATLSQPLWRALLSGAAWAAGVALLCCAPPALLGLYSPAHPGWQAFSFAVTGDRSGALPAAWLFFGVQALAEELLFRGVVTALFGTLIYWQASLLLCPLRLRAEPCGRDALRWRSLAWLISGVLAAATVGVAFGAAHNGTPAVTPLALVNIALAGFALGLLYWFRGHLAAAWSFHWVWNTLIATLGLPVSGIGIRGLPAGIATGAVPGLLSGGAYGPEGSVFCTLALAAVAAVLIRQAWRGLPSVRQAAADVLVAASIEPQP